MFPHFIIPASLNVAHLLSVILFPCCFFAASLKPLDVEFMKAIHSKVNIVPVIAKADTLTLRERDRLKRRVSFVSAHTRALPLAFALLIRSQLLVFHALILHADLFFGTRLWARMSAEHLTPGCGASPECPDSCVLSYQQLDVLAIIE